MRASSRLRPFAGRGELGGQGRADPGLPVTVEEAADLELTEGDEPVHAITGPEKHFVVHADLDLPERQWPRARLEHDRRLVPDLEPLGEAEVVEVGRQPQTRVDRVNARLIRPAQREGPRVDGRGEEVLALLALRRVVEGQLRQDEEVLAAQSLPGAAECRQDQLGIRLEALAQAEAGQQLLGVLARAVAGEHARGQRAVHGLRAHMGDADGRRAGGRQQQHRNQRARSPRRDRQPTSADHWSPAPSVSWATMRISGFYGCAWVAQFARQSAAGWPCWLRSIAGRYQHLSTPFAIGPRSDPAPIHTSRPPDPTCAPPPR